ncbi:hypothetical protein [Bifidobacterium aquikefiri]|uniref:hypothetical protein n=1 Tax=Bifidobacterium aquikefiri TaxID=1653207 RepID=UPI001B80CCEF|nr:hypothetical protein [Bifidobacterium aquikefiri]
MTPTVSFPEVTVVIDEDDSLELLDPHAANVATDSAAKDTAATTFRNENRVIILSLSVSGLGNPTSWFLRARPGWETDTAGNRRAMRTTTDSADGLANMPC